MNKQTQNKLDEIKKELTEKLESFSHDTPSGVKTLNLEPIQTVVDLVMAVVELKLQENGLEKRYEKAIKQQERSIHYRMKKNDKK